MTYVETAERLHQHRVQIEPRTNSSIGKITKYPEGVVGETMRVFYSARFAFDTAIFCTAQQITPWQLDEREELAGTWKVELGKALYPLFQADHPEDFGHLSLYDFQEHYDTEYALLAAIGQAATSRIDSTVLQMIVGDKSEIYILSGWGAMLMEGGLFGILGSHLLYLYRELKSASVFGKELSAVHVVEQAKEIFNKDSFHSHMSTQLRGRRYQVECPAYASIHNHVGVCMGLNMALGKRRRVDRERRISLLDPVTKHFQSGEAMIAQYEELTSRGK